MPEAVIVSAARSPIGRAFKGSLKDLRPDDLAATIIRAALDKVPGARPARHRRPAARLRPARRRAGLQHGPRSSASCIGMDHVPGATITRYCSSSLQTTRMAFHAIKAGEGDVFISAGVETVSRFAKGNSDRLPDTQQPGLRRRRGAHREDAPRRPAADAGTTRARTAWSPTPTSRWARPPRTSPRCAASPGRSWTSSACARRTSPRRPSPTASGQREITPVTTPDGTVVSTDDGPRAGVTLEAVSRPQAGLPPRRRGHRRQLLPAQRRRRRGGRHVRHQGRRARPHPAGPDRRDRRQRACPPRSWASARSRPPGARSPTPA